MGTSTARRNPGGSEWENLSKNLKKAKPAAEVADTAIKAVLPVLPNGSVKAPLYVTSTEAIKFTYNVKQKGFPAAVKDYTIAKAASKSGSAIGQAIWNSATSDLPPSARNTMTMKIMGNAFKETFAKITKEGVKAL